MSLWIFLLSTLSMTTGQSSIENLKNSLSSVVILDAVDVFDEFSNLNFTIHHQNKLEIIRQAFLAFDNPMLTSVGIANYCLNVQLDFQYLIGAENYDSSMQYELNNVFKKIIIILYSKCFEHKLFVGTNFPTIPRFPYFLENVDLAGFVLRLDTTYF